MDKSISRWTGLQCRPCPAVTHPEESWTESSRKPGDRSPRRRIQGNPREIRTTSETPRDNHEYFYHHQRPELTACSWLTFSSPPAVRAGNVNRNVTPCPV